MWGSITDMKNDYKATIGLEIHAELKTKTKMFCESKNDPHASEPNTHVCPVCMGHPGTLPVINKEAVQQVLMVGTALGAELASFTEFDRKNYFYPDIPKGYQISQYQYPLVSGGELAGVSITRVHLEEDTARSLHDQGEGSLVDYNRAGVPLMELVTEPVMHDAKTAGTFARELQLLLRTLGVSDANMEKGEMRVEANISVSKTDELGTKVEVKNLNSFKSVEAAIIYEVARHIDTLEKGGEIIQETRGWNENTGKTFSQRKKESSHDYRYFPDPDLPKLDITKTDILSRINDIMPELPSNKRQKYKNLGLTSNQIEVLVSNLDLGAYFDEVVKLLGQERDMLKTAANYLTSDLLGLLANDSSMRFGLSSTESFASLVKIVASGTITSRVAKDLLEEVVISGKDPVALVKERGLTQASSEDELLPIVEQVLTEHPEVAAEYKSGKESALQFLIGQGMRISRGSANPGVLAKLIKERIAS